MTRAVLILRPQPGANETAARARARGLEPVVAPLFTVRPLDWEPPALDGFDAILFTSANAPRHGGEGLDAFRALPCYAVGPATARAAADAGFTALHIGAADAAEVVGRMAAAGVRRALHPTSPEPAELASDAVVLEQVAVYIALPYNRLPDVAVTAINAGAVALLHSPRAAEAFGDYVGERRERTRVAAISAAAAAAAGTGWADLAVAREPRDDALLDAAETLTLALPPRAPSEPPPSDAEPVAAVPAPPVRPPRRSWSGVALASLVAFLLGVGAMSWLLLRWEPAARYLGIVPAPAAASAQRAPAPALPTTRPPDDRPESGVSPDGGTIVIDPEVARRVGSLEQRVGEIGTDTQEAVGNADRAEALLVAFAARRALDRGGGLGYLEGLLRDRFGGSRPQAVGTIIAAAREQVTLERLQDGLEEVGPQLTGVAPDQSFWQALRAEAASVVTVRRGGTPSTDPRERLHRATEQLAAGRVDTALAEVLRMPGRDNAQGWVSAAARYVAAREALDAIEVAALTEPRTPPPGQAVSSSPTPPAP